MFKFSSVQKGESQRVALDVQKGGPPGDVREVGVGGLDFGVYEGWRLPRRSNAPVTLFVTPGKLGLAS
jgi:hypothetical protein